jgi:hypothetical protein
MEEMKWFSRAMLGVLAVNKLGFGLALSETICQSFVKRQCHRDMECPKSATQSPLLDTSKEDEVVQ